MKKHLPSVVLGLVAGAFLAAATVAIADRNASGTFSLAASNPVVSGTTVASTWANNTLSDIATNLTSSLDRSARGGMLSNLQLADGSVTTPGLDWVSEAGSGLFRAGAADIRMSISQSAKTFWNATGFGVGVAPTVRSEVLSVDNLAATNIFQVRSNDTNAGIALGFNVIRSIGVSGNNSLKLQPQAAGGTVSLAKSDGTVIAQSSDTGLVIGATGTAISQSNRGTANLTPANINAQTCASFTAITVTGAAVGAECAIGQPAAGANAMSLTCAITALNTCTIQACNPTAGVLTPTAGNYSCRAFNP